MGMKQLVMVSSTALFVTLIALMTARETDGEDMSLCIPSNWSKTFNEDGWSRCPSSHPLISALNISLPRDGGRYFIIKSAKCCKPTPDSHAIVSYKNVTVPWVSGDFKAGSMCPDHYFISGLYRSTKTISMANCSRSTRHQISHCQNKTFSVPGAENLTCPEGHYLNSIRKVCQSIYSCKDSTIECCNLRGVNMEYYFYVTIFNIYGKDVRVVATFKNSTYKNINIQDGDDYTIKTVENTQKVNLSAFDGETLKKIKINNKYTVEVTSSQTPSVFYVEQRPSTKPTASETPMEAPSTKPSSITTTGPTVTVNETETKADLPSLSKKTITPRSAGPIGRNLLSITRQSDTFNVQNTLLAVDILRKLVSDGNFFNETSNDFLGIVSNLQLVNKSILLESQRMRKTSNRIRMLIDEYTDNVPLLENGTLKEVRRNLAVFVQRINATKFKGITATIQQEPKNKNKTFIENQFHISVKPNRNGAFLISITLPRSILNNTRFTPTRMSFVIFRNPTFFLPVNESENKTFEAIAAARFNGNHSYKNLQDPVVIKFNHGKLRNHEMKPVCVFWETGAKEGFGDWSTDGCILLETKNGISTCHCNHLTHFGLLLNPYNHLLKGDQVALEIISYVGCGLSLAGVTFTAISFMLSRDERRKSGIKLIISFCVALALLLITFILGAVKSSSTSDWQCQTAAIFLHYFTLVVFANMAAMGHNLYVRLVHNPMVQHNKTTKSCFPLKYLFVNWGIPIVVVAITVAVSLNSYGNGNYCSLVGLPAVVSLAVPVAIIILANAVSFVKIALRLRESPNISSSKRTYPGQQLLREISILVLLGITWVFGFLTLGNATLTFQYLFVIFNSFQGFLIFVLYCLVPKKMRTKYIAFFKCTKNDNLHSKDTRNTLSMNII